MGDTLYQKINSNTIQILIQALAAGFPDTIDTYGLVSGLWTSTFALGAFIGPTLAGILFDSVGFPWATMLVIGVHILVLAFLVVFAVFCQKSTLQRVKKESLLKYIQSR